MKVLKFGGSSVAKPERIDQVISILAEKYLKKNIPITVVFSAFGGVTDQLLEMASLAAKGDIAYKSLFEQFHTRHIHAIGRLINNDQRKLEVIEFVKQNHKVLKNLLYGVFLVREASERTMDYVLSFGERNSTYIISETLIDRGFEASYLDARKVIKTNKQFGAATVNMDLSYQTIRAYYENNSGVQIVTGFIGSAKGGLTTTLGRGGSDYTASLLAAALQAEVVEIWTDVDGVLTADPRKVSNAFTIPELTYEEAMEMAHFGAKVIYPPTLQPVLTDQIPVVIKNTFNPDFPGTYISHQESKDQRAVKGISSINKISLLTLQGSGLFGVPGIAGRLFSALSQAGINIILITQGSSEHAISFAIAPKDAHRAKLSVDQAFEQEIVTGAISPIRLEEKLSVVAVIGNRMRYQPGVAGRLFSALGKNGINAVAIAQGSSELNISVVINDVDEAKALNALHEAYFLSSRKVMNLFIVGVGLIGGTLLKQLRDQHVKLKENVDIEFRVAGLANSKKMLFREKGIPLDNWKDELLHNGSEMNMAQFIEQMKTLNLRNSIFIDNTALNDVVPNYLSILDYSISISTPNKAAAASHYADYLQLKQMAAQRHVQFFYETNVGAGLPIISTIRDLINSGDKILKIEGVLSGSLSFIFNQVNRGVPFSEAVTLAKQKGYTEPDPRIDLSGNDVRRKILILAREIGLNVNVEDIIVENFIPQEYFDLPSLDGFMSGLNDINQIISNERAQLGEGEKLCFNASAEHGNIKIGLEKISDHHPFATLSGSDNMVVITSERYKERPLVVRGPGAGAEVTAAGVFAEIIKIAHYH